jgi:hypothetical protein
MSNNESFKITRRYPDLKRKVLLRDSEISQRLTKAWDIENNGDKVLEIFLKEAKNLSDERYWELLRTVWIICGGVSRLNIFMSLFSSKRKQRYYFSTPEEQRRLRELPERFEVYRATNTGDEGISWTLSMDYAEQFKKEFDKETIITRIVKRQEVFALIERNMEEEIIIL